MRISFAGRKHPVAGRTRRCGPRRDRQFGDSRRERVPRAGQTGCHANRDFTECVNHQVTCPLRLLCTCGKKLIQDASVPVPTRLICCFSAAQTAARLRFLPYLQLLLRHEFHFRGVIHRARVGESPLPTGSRLTLLCRKLHFRILFSK